MAFSASDLDAIDRAIVALGTGTQVTEVQIDGRRVQYSAAQLGDLMKLRSFIAGQVATVTADPALQSGGVTYAEWGGRA